MGDDWNRTAAAAADREKRRHLSNIIALLDFQKDKTNQLSSPPGWNSQRVVLRGWTDFIPHIAQEIKCVALL